MTVKAPPVTSLTISKLSANAVQLTWDEVGENFYYLVEMQKTREVGQLIWQPLGYTADNKWFSSDLTASSYYKFRVSVASEGFDPSEWVETEEFQTFEQNAYSFDVMNELTLNGNFIKEKFIKGNNDYVNFTTDVIHAALINESFVYSDAYSHISQISNYIIKENEYHEIQGDITSICRDLDRMYLMEDDGILYLFERWQNLVKVSNDKGQTWQAVNLMNDRVGWPLSKTVFYQNSTTDYVLGWDRVFYGRKSTDIRWSSDEVRFSSDDVTFAKIGDTLNLGFDVNIFGTYARLPADVSQIAEAITCNDEYIYVVARDKVRYAKTKNAPIDTDPLSPTRGEKLFEKGFQNITGNPKAVVWKMDSVGGRIFALVIGEVANVGDDPRKTPIRDSALKGVYILEDHDSGKWTRVFGNTPEERRRIELGYTNMSCDDKEIFISSSNYKILPQDIVDDPETVAKYPNEVNKAVKALYEPQWIHDKHLLMMSFRANAQDGWNVWKTGRMRYYAEPYFSKCKNSNTRCWVNNSNKVVMVYSDVTHEYAIDPFPQTSPSRFMKEVWNTGDCTVIFPNIEFNNFTQYANGIMFYRYSGELIGYYEFNYRVKDNVRIVWKPTNIFLKAYMQNQTRELPWKPDYSDGYNNPDLRPFLTRMIPDSYLLEDSNFEKFCEYYIQYISDGYGTPYNNLVNLIRDKYPKEKHSWEYMWSEIYKRNIYLNKDKRDLVARFFETRKNDFYSTKGIEASYKFLFKVLYNEDVEIDIESANGLEYDIIVESDNITEDLAGRTVYTATGRSNVTYIERHYNKGKLQWKLTIHNLLGRFLAGQEIKSEKTNFEGMIVQGVRGKDMTSNTIEYINRGRAYYVMKIKSALPSSRYRDDVLRFVHPVGFGFVGITLITMFINSGLSMKHTETIINKLKVYRWDSGLPSKWPDRVAKFGPDDKIDHDVITGEPLYLDSPNKGKDFPLRPDYMQNNPGLYMGLNADQRRRPMSPLFDQSAVTFSRFRDLVNERLKSNIGNPRDPSKPTQVKVNE
ncbi:baseplate wedge initiator [Acinetobacter phage AB1I1M-1]